MVTCYICCICLTGIFGFSGHSSSPYFKHCRKKACFLDMGVACLSSFHYNVTQSFCGCGVHLAIQHIHFIQILKSTLSLFEKSEPWWH